MSPRSHRYRPRSVYAHDGARVQIWVEPREPLSSQMGRESFFIHVECANKPLPAANLGRANVLSLACAAM